MRANHLIYGWQTRLRHRGRWAAPAAPSTDGGCKTATLAGGGRLDCNVGRRDDGPVHAVSVHPRGLSRLWVIGRMPGFLRRPAGWNRSVAAAVLPNAVLQRLDTGAPLDQEGRRISHHDDAEDILQVSGRADPAVRPVDRSAGSRLRCPSSMEAGYRAIPRTFHARDAPAASCHHRLPPRTTRPAASPGRWRSTPYGGKILSRQDGFRGYISIYCEHCRQAREAVDALRRIYWDGMGMEGSPTVRRARRDALRKSVSRIISR